MHKLYTLISILAMTMGSATLTGCESQDVDDEELGDGLGEDLGEDLGENLGE